MCSETEIKRNELHRKIDRLWEIFWTGGITNPLDVSVSRIRVFFPVRLNWADARSMRSRCAGLR